VGVRVPELLFKGKEFVHNHHLTVPVRPIVPHPERSVGSGGLDGNLVIQGDNLDALKALLPFYAGRVNCVFIDPPYNTGNEGWSYNDNVNSPMLQAWLSANPVGIEDGLRHDKWLAMMLPRIKLLRELMAEDGSFWMTLDDNEIHRARLLLDEVFGADNFIATCVWQRKDTAGIASTFSNSHDYLVGYIRSDKVDISRLERTADQISNYKNPDKDPRGPWLGSPITRGEYREHDDYPLTNTAGREIRPPRGTSWRIPKEVLLKLNEDGLIYWGKEGNASFPFLKKYLDGVRGGVTPTTWWSYEVAGSNRNATAELRQIFDGQLPFQNAKPVKLLTRLFELVTKPNSIILDAFAGSATTGHAVLAANVEDNGQRRFLLIESEAYADTLTAERLRRVINGYAFTGNQRTELLREPMTLTTLRNAGELLDQVASVEALEGASYDSIEKSVKAGVLTVTGLKRIQDHAPGLGGNFTFCTLGAAVDLGAMLAGDDLPCFATLGAGLFHAATHAPFDPDASQPPPDSTELDADGLGYLGETAALHVWMLYRPDKAWLTSQAAALTQARAKDVAGRKPPGKRHLVFAATRFVPQRVLDEAKIPVEFAPLPFGRERPADLPATTAAPTGAVP